MALKGHKSIRIRTVDIDVLVLSLASFFYLAEEIDQFWIDFGTGKNRKFFAIHEICDVLKKDVSHFSMQSQDVNRCRFFLMLQKGLLRRSGACLRRLLQVLKN